MLARAVGSAGVVALLLGCGGPSKSPFFLWSIRPGMPLDSLEGRVVPNALRGVVEVWERCDTLAGGARRCERRLESPTGTLRIVEARDGTVPYVAFAPEPREVAFDDSLDVMERQWARTKGVKTDPHDVSESNPRGIAEMRSGRWRALMTFDGGYCEVIYRFCPSLIQLVDWRAGRQYVDTIVPPRPAIRLQGR